MTSVVNETRLPVGVKVLAAGLVGLIVGAVGTIAALGSVEFAVFGGVACAVVAAIVAVNKLEKPQV